MTEIPYPYCYIGRLPCGCTVAAHVDSGGKDKTLAQWLKDWINRGLTVERVKTEDVKLVPAWDCPHEQPKSEARQSSLFDLGENKS